MSSVFFNGRQFVSPATASMVNTEALQPQNASVGNIAAFLGRAAGGQPNTVLRFGSPAEAKRSLISGELLDAILAAFSPSPETAGPSQVVAIRVGTATQATANVLNASAAAVIGLTSKNWGLRENQIKYKIEAGTTSGLRVTTARGNDYCVGDNLARRAFSVHYTGAEASATMTISNTSVVLAAPAGTTVATIDLTQYPTVLDVVDRINLVAGFDASVLDNSYSSPALNGLDAVTTQDVKTAAYTARADLQAVIDWLNGPAQIHVSATRSGPAVVPALVDWTFLAGGSDGTSLVSDWANAFETLQHADVQWIAPVSGDGAVHALADAHVAYMSTVAMKERRAICGTVSGTSDLAAITAASGLNSARTSLVHLGHYNYNAAGVLTLYPPYITAALIAGAFSGVSPGTPLTNKSINVKGLERELRNPTDTDALIQGGILCVENADGVFKVVQSISTWLVDDNYAMVEQSTGAALDYTARHVRKKLDVLRGAKGGPISLSRAISVTESALKELAVAEPVGPGILVGDSTSPAYRNISASIQGDVIRVQFECSPAIPLNYVLVSIYAKPYSGTASAS